jgi:L-malate glycosyltransferase
MKVAMVAAGELFGGAERQILTLSVALRELGCEVQAFVGFEHLLAAKLRESGVETSVVPLDGRYKLAFAAHLQRELNARRIRCIHLHNYQPAILLGARGRARGTGVVKTEHGMPELTGASALETLKLRGYRALECWSLRRLRATVVYVTAEMQARSRADHARLATMVIPNGIAPLSRESTQRPPTFAQDRLNVVLVGRLEAVKGLPHAVRALKEPNAPARCHLHIIGTGPQADFLRAEIEALGLEEWVTLGGFTDRPLDFIAHADALLLPSMHEGLPYVVLEAMSLGTPVLASAVGGIPEIVRHDVNGLLFEPARPAAIAAALRRLAEEPTLREQLAAAATLTVRERYSAAGMAHAYLDVYRSAMEMH